MKMIDENLLDLVYEHLDHDIDRHYLDEMNDLN
jgi:hypothetical protein